jgi:splicing factor 1
MGRRWSEERAELTLPCEAPPGLSAAQLHTYLLQVRLEEINRKLAHGDLRPSCYLPPGSTIPATLRAQLEDERARLIEEALKRNPEFMMPIDYASHIRDNRNPNPSANTGNTGNVSGGTAGSLTDASGALTPAAQALLNDGGIRKIGNRWAEKIWIPQRDFPDVNFVGLLIGPRGNTLKKMEAESGARISIRGKGSLKEGGAGGSTGSGQGTTTSSSAGADEELHALVTGDGSEKVARASRLINRIIETAVSTPEAANELKRFQLRELAALNGTLRDEEQIICANCGQPGHRRFECLERKSVTASTVCRICGGAGHLASDCVHKHDPAMLQQSKERSAHMDNEYLAFMSEISGTANAGANANANLPDATALPGPYQMDPLQVQQYYASLLQQQQQQQQQAGQAAWDPAAYAQAWHIPPPPGQ